LTKFLCYFFHGNSYALTLTKKDWATF
jgi:hypothetical protein